MPDNRPLSRVSSSSLSFLFCRRGRDDDHRRRISRSFRIRRRMQSQRLHTQQTPTRVHSHEHRMGPPAIAWHAAFVSTDCSLPFDRRMVWGRVFHRLCLVDASQRRLCLLVDGAGQHANCARCIPRGTFRHDHAADAGTRWLHRLNTGGSNKAANELQVRKHVSAAVSSCACNRLAASTDLRFTRSSSVLAIKQLADLLASMLDLDTTRERHRTPQAEDLVPARMRSMYRLAPPPRSLVLTFSPAAAANSATFPCAIDSPRL